jgi:anti-anti-sigma factor
MPLSINSRVEDNIGILELSGSLTLGPSLSGLREGARQLLSTARLAGIILHVKEISVTDSSGLGELTVVYTLATKRGCPIRLAETTASLRKMLEMTRLDGLLPSSDDMNAAKAAIKNRDAG